jgi:hypothetical protein
MLILNIILVMMTNYALCNAAKLDSLPERPSYRPRVSAMMKNSAERSPDGRAFWDRLGHIAAWDAVMDEDRYVTRRWNEFVSS